MFSQYEKRLLGLLVLVVLVGTILYGNEFLSMTTLRILANQLPEFGLITLAIMVTLIISGLNLSIVAMVTLSGIIGGLVMESMQSFGSISIAVGILMMIVVGCLTGMVNGIIISYLNVSPILVTLGTMLFFKGLALNITKGGAITSFDQGFVSIGNQSLLGIPLPTLILISVLCGLYYILNQSEFGKQLYRIGKNKTAAIYSGINVRLVVLQAYGIAGIIAGVTAVIMTSRYNSIRVDYGSSYLIQSIVVVSLGGIDLEGGKGTIKGVIIAQLIVSLLLRILNMSFVDVNLIDAIMGSVLIVNLLVQHLLKKRR